MTEAVLEDARAWQTRPLDDVYPVRFLDGVVLKIRDGGSVQRRACYLALAIGMDGQREVLGMCFQATEGAKFWMQVLTDLKQRFAPAITGNSLTWTRVRSLVADRSITGAPRRRGRRLRG